MRIPKTVISPFTRVSTVNTEFQNLGKSYEGLDPLKECQNCRKREEPLPLEKKLLVRGASTKEKEIGISNVRSYIQHI